MPTYGYVCKGCKTEEDRVLSIARRDLQTCHKCGFALTRKLAAPLFRFKGRVTPGGGPDRFTADMLGMRADELPSGLRTKP